MNKNLNNYISIVDFLADFLGNDTEIVLHDMTDLENSVVAIRNGHLSGREIGAPATDLVLEILKNNKYNKMKYVSNYSGKSKTGKEMRSATYFIRDNKERIVGMLCLNMDLEKVRVMKGFIDNMLSNVSVQEDHISETFSHNANELTIDIIQNIVNAYDIPPERMEQDEKIKIVSELNEKGVFLIKGAVSQTADVLKVSDATVYRYLGKLKKQSI
ncbi:MAG: transcriptional regulator [Lachnospirales bacterium]